MPIAVELEVLNELGLHARPAAEFVRCAQKFSGTVICLWRRNERYAATSILDLLSANLDQGAIFTLEAEGPEAAEAIAKLSALIVEFREQEARERQTT